MKLTLLFIFISLFSFSQFTTDITPGVPITEIKQYTKNLIPEVIYIDKYVTSRDKLGNIEGNFGLNFEDDTLIRVEFRTNGSYFLPYGKKDEPLLKKSFEEQYSAYKTLFDEYTKLYGNADSVFIADTLFKGYSEKMTTYKIMHARWDLEKTVIDLNFDFYGINESQYMVVNAAPTSFYYSFHASFVKNNTKGKPFVGKYKPGTTIHNFILEFPDLIPGGASISDVFSKSSEFVGLKGSESYYFEFDTLLYYSFNNGNEYHEDNEKNYNILLDAYEKAIVKLSDIFGDPYTQYIDNRKPYKELKKTNIYNCEVAVTTWKMIDQWVILRFDISGGKGETWLNFSVNVCRVGDYRFEE